MKTGSCFVFLPSGSYQAPEAQRRGTAVPGVLKEYVFLGHRADANPGDGVGNVAVGPGTRRLGVLSIALCRSQLHLTIICRGVYEAGTTVQRETCFFKV